MQGVSYGLINEIVVDINNMGKDDGIARYVPHGEVILKSEHDRNDITNYQFIYIGDDGSTKEIYDHTREHLGLSVFQYWLSTHVG